ncbi:MAG: ATP-binding cassette domain-containing protein [Polyangiaceae bacterium]|nr:ATP-binding cassette domain-containing protein [Polyangiaceae bacterium]
MPGDPLSVHIRFSRPKSEFLLDVAFEAPAGVTVLFGPSGSGKSTILAAIAGLITPTAGRIALGDREWFNAQNKTNVAIEHRRIAFVFQSLALFPHMTALQNAEFGIARNVPKTERTHRAQQSLARFRVDHLSQRKPATFSGGEAQRVALARAFAMSPNVVLLDEPFSALDLSLRQQFVADLRAAAQELCVPIVHVTHHRNEARALADSVILLEQGKIKARGACSDLLPPLSHRPFEGRADETPSPLPVTAAPRASADLSFAETPMPSSR